MALLWPDSDTDRARGSLKQALHVLRTLLDEPELLLGTVELRLNPEIIDTDLQQFSRLTASGHLEEAAGLYAGGFLAGVHTGAGGEFENWAQARCGDLDRRYREVLERLATDASDAGRMSQAADWLRRLQTADPVNGRVAVQLMEALEASGQRAAALQHARVHELLVREQFGLPVDGAVTELAERLQRGPAVSAFPTAAHASAPDAAAPLLVRPLPDERARDAVRSAPPHARRARRLVPILAGTIAIVLLVGGPWAWKTIDARLVRAGAAAPHDRQAAGGDDRPSVAVLPFVDMSPDGDHEYLGDGLAEELSARLAQIEGLRVAARTSAFQYKGTSPDVRLVGTNLGVATVVEGSVRRSGDRVRITAQLINTGTGYHLWSQTYETSIADVFAIEDTIGQAVAQTLRVRLSARAPRDAERGAAFDAYLRGRHHLRRHTIEGTRLAAVAFHQAVALDSTFAKAHAALADMEFYPVLTAPGPRFRRARASAERALALDDGIAEVHASVAWILMWYDRDWEGAGGHFQRALDLDPTFTQAINWSSARLTALGRVEESLALMRQAHERSPSPSNACFLAIRLLWLGRTDDALAYYRAVLSEDSTFFMARWGVGLAYLRLGRFDEAIEEFSRRGGDYMGIFQDGYLGYAYAAAGRTADARAVLARMRERMRRGEYVPPTDVALVYNGQGDVQQALDWMERHEQDRGARVFLAANPLYDPLRGEPRFQRLLERLGVGPSNDSALPSP
jgi:serine/threonine-protein kinase